MAKIKLTKNELKAQKDALKMYKRYLPTLTLKKQQLQTEIRSIEERAKEVRQARKDLEKEFDKIKGRYHLIVPERDGIGTIYEMAPRKTIARISTRNIIEAHSMMTWQINQNHVAKADMDSYMTDRTRQAFMELLENTTPEQREIFVEEIFKAFDDANITTVTQMAEGGVPIIIKVIKELAEMDPVAKSMAIKLSKVYGTSVTSDLHKMVNDKKEALKNITSRNRNVTNDEEIS